MNGQDCNQERLLTSAAPRNKRMLAVRLALWNKPRMPRDLHEQARKVLDKCGTDHDDSPAGHDKWNLSCGG